MTSKSNGSREGIPNVALGSMPVLRGAGFAAQLPTTLQNKGERGGLAVPLESAFARGAAQAMEGNSQAPSREHTSDESFSSVETDEARFGLGNNVNPLAPADGSLRNDGRRGHDSRTYLRTATQKR